jgi:predicted transcriptional regulator
LCHDAKSINEGYITKSIYKTTLLEGVKEPDKLIEKWLVDMKFIGLIRIEYDPTIKQTLIYLTEKGLEEYKNQTYHALAANLLEAQESRRLSKTAILIAIVSILIAIVTWIISCVID